MSRALAATRCCPAPEEIVKVGTRWHYLMRYSQGALICHDGQYGEAVNFKEPKHIFEHFDVL